MSSAAAILSRVGGLPWDGLAPFGESKEKKTEWLRRLTEANEWDAAMALSQGSHVPVGVGPVAVG